MRNSQTSQQVFEKKPQVVVLLDNLLEIFSIDKGQLAEKLRYDRASFSRIYNGKEEPPEKFLLIAQLTLENELMRRRLESIEKAQKTLSVLTFNEISSIRTKPFVSVELESYSKPPTFPARGRTKKGRA